MIKIKKSINKSSFMNSNNSINNDNIINILNKKDIFEINSKKKPVL